MRAMFYRHVIGGLAIGMMLGAGALAAMIWLITPHSPHLPWSFAAFCLVQAAFTGGLVGVATFMRTIWADGAAGDGPGGGLKQQVRARLARAPASVLDDAGAASHA